MIETLGREPFAAVPDEQRHLAVAGGQFDPELFAGRRVFDRIAQQIADQFADQPGVAADLRRAVVDFEIEVFFGDQRRQFERRFARQSVDVADFGQTARAALFDLGQQQHLVGQFDGAFDGGFHLDEHLGGRRVAANP